MKTYGFNDCETSSMCQVCDEHSQTLCVTHSVGREVYGIRYNQSEKSAKPYMLGVSLCLSAMCPDAGVVICKRPTR